MMRFFRVSEETHPALREAVRTALGQPNESANAPWGKRGDFTIGGWVYIAFGPYHALKFSDLIEAFKSSSGAEEISLADYHAARPQEADL